jgi:hypothetical protein
MTERQRTSLLNPVLGLGFPDGLPLHVARYIGAATLQRPDMVDDVARTGARRSAGGGAGMLALKLVSGGGTACNPAAAIAHAGSATC